MHLVNFSYKISLKVSNYRAELNLFNHNATEIMRAISTKCMYI